MNDLTYKPGLHRFAWVVTVAMWVMIVAGGMVTSMGAGDSVPDWPLSYDSVLPPMVGGVLYEHGHRMIGWALGLLAITLAGWLWTREPRKWVRTLGYVALAAVCFQGVLGGIRVLVVSNDSVREAVLGSDSATEAAVARTVFAILHTTVGQAILCLAAVIATVTARRWLKTSEPVACRGADKVRRWCIVVAAALFIQVILGAVRRQTEGTIAMHLTWAFVVTAFIIALYVRVLLSAASVRELTRPATWLVLALAVQMMLGFASWGLTNAAIAGTVHMPELGGSVLLASVIRTAHLGVGAAMLAIGVTMVVRSYKYVSAAPAIADERPAVGRTATA